MFIHKKSSATQNRNIFVHFLPVIHINHYCIFHIQPFLQKLVFWYHHKQIHVLHSLEEYLPLQQEGTTDL